METRLVAIMLTDAPGYTEFSAGADRDIISATIAQQKRIIEPIIEEYHGRIIKWIGDAALIVFQSGTDAILCGRLIQLKFIELAERGEFAINPTLKVVVHVGDVNVDKDGDIYGDAVNLTARIEKLSKPDEVYFTESARLVISQAEIPYEYVGEFELKGISGTTRIFRTTFGQTPVVRERIAIMQTNFVSVNDLADRFGWDVVHPILDDVTGQIIESTRKFGGTNRGVSRTGCLLSFNNIISAFSAINNWRKKINTSSNRLKDNETIKVRSAIHWGTLHIMKYTMLGIDIDLVVTLAALGYGEEILLSESAYQTASSEGVNLEFFSRVKNSEFRKCSSRKRWLEKFDQQSAYKLRYSDLENFPLSK